MVTDMVCVSHNTKSGNMKQRCKTRSVIILGLIVCHSDC